jgi:hypothetical protein
MPASRRLLLRCKSHAKFSGLPSLAIGAGTFGPALIV